MNEYYLVMRGIQDGNLFWTSSKMDVSPEKTRYLNDGTLAYDILFISLSREEAKLFYSRKLARRAIKAV